MTDLYSLPSFSFFVSFHDFFSFLVSTSSLLSHISLSFSSFTYQVVSWPSSTARRSSKSVAVERRGATSRAKSQACITMVCRCSNWRPRVTPTSRPRVTCVWWVTCPQCSLLTPPPPRRWLICPPQSWRQPPPWPQPPPANSARPPWGTVSHRWAVVSLWFKLTHTDKLKEQTVAKRRLSFEPLSQGDILVQCLVMEHCQLALIGFLKFLQNLKVLRTISERLNGTLT